MPYEIRGSTVPGDDNYYLIDQDGYTLAVISPCGSDVHKAIVSDLFRTAFEALRELE